MVLLRSFCCSMQLLFHQVSVCSSYTRPAISVSEIPQVMKTSDIDGTDITETENYQDFTEKNLDVADAFLIFSAET